MHFGAYNYIKWEQTQKSIYYMITFLWDEEEIKLYHGVKKTKTKSQAPDYLWWWELTGNACKGNIWVDGNLNLNWVLITFIWTHWIIHLTYVHFNVCKFLTKIEDSWSYLFPFKKY